MQEIFEQEGSEKEAERAVARERARLFVCALEQTALQAGGSKSEFECGNMSDFDNTRAAPHRHSEQRKIWRAKKREK